MDYFLCTLILGLREEKIKQTSILSWSKRLYERQQSDHIGFVLVTLECLLI